MKRLTLTLDYEDFFHPLKNIHQQVRSEIDEKQFIDLKKIGMNEEDSLDYIIQTMYKELVISFNKQFKENKPSEER